MSRKFINASTSSTETETKAYGQWSSQRELAAIEGTIEFHTFETKRGGVTSAWNKIFGKVNKVDGHLKQLSDNAIKNRISKLIEDVHVKPRNPMFLIWLQVILRSMQVAWGKASMSRGSSTTTREFWLAN
ncbi:hypothetical protein INT47_006868 [Mucor saturninus]|uniref:Uncharacterized protein n=1 Tax=Mucor saturninus TaxID=64648 RepID=A0A8H7RAX2_9FUNG|nr:hypothetical protein INT47_006868 [Mucor saturninus]